MSRPYRLRVAETVRRHVVVEDGLECGLDLLQIVPREEETQILEEELARRGFVIEAGTARREDASGVVAQIDLAARRVHVGKRAEREIERTETRIVSSDTAQVTEQQRAAVRRQAELSLEREREQERRALTAEIEAGLADLRAELDEIAVKVTQEALRRKAARMGEIESVTEDPESGSLTIRIRV